jgi:glycosyltransferase involved in cell wall biosynthesis
MRPFFSIGVTTYDRLALLKETLTSISRQTFEDFEVIVGNDHAERPLSLRVIGVDDPRIRIVNHPENLGEVGNMNALLRQTEGRYFTWLADDDLYAPGFLEAIYEALRKFDGPPAAFTSYEMGRDPTLWTPPRSGTAELLTGREFVRGYLGRTLKVLGCCGLFDTAMLKAFGGMERLGVGFSPYSDNLLAIRCGVLSQVVYLETPLIFYRAHRESISLASRDLEAYHTAQADLLGRAVRILGTESLREDFARNLSELVRWCVRDFATVAARAGRLTLGQSIAYLMAIRPYVRHLRHSPFYWGAIGAAIRALAGSFVKVRLTRWR